MSFNYDNQPKEWSNKCPKCRSDIRWSLSSSRTGATSVAYCANNLFSSRESMSRLKDIKVCFWKGSVVRQKDGGIRFKNSDSSWIK